MKRVFLKTFCRTCNTKRRKWTGLVWNGQVWACLFYSGYSVLAKVW